MGKLLPTLNFKTDWTHVQDFGDYAFTELFNIPVLVMRCPFCNSEAPFPPMFKKISRQNPLTIEGSITCPGCEAIFIIRDGVAFRAGVISELLKEAV